MALHTLIRDVLIREFRISPEAIRLAPSNALPYLARAAAYLKNGNYKKAIEDCNAAISLGNKDK